MRPRPRMPTRMTTSGQGDDTGDQPDDGAEHLGGVRKSFHRIETLSPFVNSRQQLGAMGCERVPDGPELFPFEPGDERVEVRARELKRGESLVVVAEAVE